MAPVVIMQTNPSMPRRQQAYIAPQKRQRTAKLQRPAGALRSNQAMCGLLVVGEEQVKTSQFQMISSRRSIPATSTSKATSSRRSCKTDHPTS